MVEAILNFLSSIISKIPVSNEAKKNREKYDELRMKVSEAMTLYSRYYNNPVDIAKMPNNILPEDYSKASEEIRKLAAKLRALSETMPSKGKKASARKKSLFEASQSLIGLSNCFTTAFNCDVSSSHYEIVRSLEEDIRGQLHLISTR